MKLDDLDAAICSHLVRGFGHPTNSMELENMARRCHPRARVAWRVIDRRMQAMRKEGRIVYDKSRRKWEVMF